MKKNYYYLLVIIVMTALVSVSCNKNNNLITVKGVSFELVSIEGGTFIMGRTDDLDDDNPAFDWEEPARPVTLNGFRIAKHQVTQELWRAVMGENPSYFIGDSLPVESVSWDDVNVFIGKLNELTGRQFRLPTEAEWEFAARGGNKSEGHKFSGSDFLNEVGWYWENCDNRTHPVGRKSPNELGLYDMSGNVWEWCNDWYGEYHFEAQADPSGPTEGSQRVLRGGGWRNDAKRCRVAFRGSGSQTYAYMSLGFRLAHP
jgi:formylglycine-generating enzyme required for sulfatase activity